MMNSQFQIKNNFNVINPNTTNNSHFPYINQKYTNESKAYNKESPQASRIFKKSGSKVRFFYKIIKYS